MTEAVCQTAIILGVLPEVVWYDMDYTEMNTVRKVYSEMHGDSGQKPGRTEEADDMDLYLAMKERAKYEK